MAGRGRAREAAGLPSIRSCPSTGHLSSQVSGACHRRWVRGPARVSCPKGGEPQSTTNTGAVGVHLVSLRPALFQSGLSLLLLGPSTQGTQAEAAALCSECFPPCLLSRQRGPERLLTLQVSLSFFYSGGLNKGFGRPGLERTAAGPPSLPSAQDQCRTLCPCFLPVEAAQGRVSPATSCPSGCGRTHSSSSACLCPASEWQLPPREGPGPLTARCS